MNDRSRGGGFRSCCGVLSDALDRIGLGLAVILFLINVGDIALGVFARYVLKSSLVWTEELARFSMVWMVMLAAAPALKNGEHMAITMVVARFPGWGRWAARWINHLVFVGVTILMSGFGYVYALKMSAFTTMGLGWPKSVPLMAVPVGMTLLFLQYLLMQLGPGRRSPSVGDGRSDPSPIGSRP